MTYEVIQKHEYQDIYRIQYGCLLKVNKYINGQSGWLYGDKIKGKSKKVNGIKNCFILSQDIQDWNQVYKKGTILLDTRPIILVNKNQYWIELKFSGGTFVGDIEEYSNFKDKIDLILSEYKIPI